MNRSPLRAGICMAHQNFIIRIGAFGTQIFHRSLRLTNLHATRSIVTTILSFLIPLMTLSTLLLFLLWVMQLFHSLLIDSLFFGLSLIHVLQSDVFFSFMQFLLHVLHGSRVFACLCLFLSVYLHNEYFFLCAPQPFYFSFFPA
jgi:hypothetical protein